MDEPLPSAGSLPLIGGQLCLDFANTADWHASEAPEELLRTYADLVAWGLHVPILSEEDAAALRRLASADPAAAEDALGRARELREAIFRIFTAVAQRCPVPMSDLALLNRALAAALPHRRLAASGQGRQGGAACIWHWEGLAAALDGILWPAAVSAAELLTAAELSRVGCCADERCGWLFLDTSKNGRRRWCSMEGCGNRAKARRHYQRQRAATQP